MGPFLHLHHGLQFLVVLLCAVPQDHLDRLRVEDHSSLVHVTFHQNRWLVFLLGEYPILPKLLKLLLQGDCLSCRAPVRRNSPTSDQRPRLPPQDPESLTSLDGAQVLDLQEGVVLFDVKARSSGGPAHAHYLRMSFYACL